MPMKQEKQQKIGSFLPHFPQKTMRAYARGKLRFNFDFRHDNEIRKCTY